MEDEVGLGCVHVMWSLEVPGLSSKGVGLVSGARALALPYLLQSMSKGVELELICDSIVGSLETRATLSSLLIVREYIL